MAFQKVEFEFPDDDKDNQDLDIEGSGAIDVDVGGKGKNTRGEDIKKPEDDDDGDDGDDGDDKPEIEVIDDTPKEDRGRKPSDPPEEVTDEELENYSDKVRNRIKHFSKGYHDERRAKETALRERQELEALAQKLVEENKALKQTGNKSQTALIQQAKANAENAYNVAKTKYKNAYNDGDADKVLEAQEALSNAKARLEKIDSYVVTPLQEEEDSVQLPQRTQEPQAQVDTRAAEWAKENKWFNTDEEMTSFALGLHNKLVKEGVSPQSDTYYDKINSRMRQVFPENFDDESPKQQSKKSNNVVAPASRSTGPKKIRLTQTQVTLAKRLGLTNEQYAKQVAIDMKRNS